MDVSNDRQPAIESDLSLDGEKKNPPVAPQQEDADVRTEKIKQIRDALANGTYEIPSSEIAEKIIDEMRGPKE